MFTPKKDAKNLLTTLKKGNRIDLQTKREELTKIIKYVNL